MKRVLWVLMLALVSFPRSAAAHDDPVVTVRVMCDGFNVLDMDQVLGEISDSATIHFDRTVQGAGQVQAWVKQQMDDDLRIEIVDIGTPHRLPDGYTLSWTARFSRRDWRKAGIDTRQATNEVVIHNGRITEWTAALDSGSGAQTGGAAPVGVPISSTRTTDAFPEVFGIPVTLILAVALAIGGGSFVARSALRR
jgi:hypothetical protein